MLADAALLVALLTVAAFIALPAVLAARRRNISREASEVAEALAQFALGVRRERRFKPLDETLHARVQRLRIPEFAALSLAQDLPRLDPELLADVAQRLALRLKRRVAFERKMLARTTSGRQRGAVAAAVPPVLLLLLSVLGVAVPAAALWSLLAVEGFGCWLLWRLARVEI